MDRATPFGTLLSHVYFFFLPFADCCLQYHFKFLLERFRLAGPAVLPGMPARGRRVSAAPSTCLSSTPQPVPFWLLPCYCFDLFVTLSCCACCAQQPSDLRSHIFLLLFWCWACYAGCSLLMLGGFGIKV